MSCLNDSEYWTCGDDKSMRLDNLKGESLKTVKTSLRNMLKDITVTRNTNLVFTDYNDGSLNSLQNTDASLNHTAGLETLWSV